MILAVKGDITKVKVEAIVNSTNGLYIMNKGVSFSVLSSGGEPLKNEIKKYKEKNGILKEGDFYSTTGGNLIQNGVKTIYHAVINNTPDDNTSIYFINNIVNKILQKAIKDKVSIIAFTGLGTGCCCLNKNIVATNMLDSFEKYHGLIKIIIVDIDEELINIFKEKI